MLDRPLTRSDLVAFFTLPKKRPDDTRPLCRVLRDLGIRLRGGTTRWPIVWHALGLAEHQDPAHHAALTEPLLTAQAVADLLGVSTSILYRWEKGRLPKGAPPFPASIDLSNGRKAARARRWRKAEVLAWHMGRPAPRYAMPAPVFGAIMPGHERPAPAPDTASGAQPSGTASRRPGHERPAGFTGGNPGGVCVPRAVR